MAGENHPIPVNSSAQLRILQLLRALDPAALEALASKGLLRRAQKDLERGLASVLHDDAAQVLRVKVDQFKVEIPEAGPAKATCTCPASGVCQHILTAILLLQQQQPSIATESSTHETRGPGVEEEFLAFTASQLEAWAGKSTFKAALQFAVQSPVEISAGGSLVVRFPAANAQCHFAPGGGLDGIIVSGNPKHERRLAVAAVIAFQRSRGVAWELPATAGGTLEETEGAPRSRSEVLDASRQVLVEMLDQGLARLSSAMQQRLATLAVSALGVNLPRLSLMLRSLSDECALVSARDARSDLRRMLVRMAQTHALGAALQRDTSQRPDLVGWHRTRYEEVGNLDLIGVAAWPWRTASGYAGLTVLFWDSRGKIWSSWSESRPTHQDASFNPVGRYTQPGPWEGAESPKQLARSAFRLMNAKRNPLNRLSASGKTRALVTGPAHLRDAGLPVIEDWAALAEPLSAQIAVGLKETNPLNSIFAVKPTTWGERAYNPVTQVFNWVLLDAQQRPLLLELAFDSLTDPAIKHLEAASPESLSGALVIGRVQRAGGGISIHPHSLHLASGQAVHLCLDNVKADAPVGSLSAEAEEDTNPEDEEPDEGMEALSPAIVRILDEADDALLALAEAGIGASSGGRLEVLLGTAARAERLGLEILAAGLSTAASQPGALALLRSAYFNQLHRSALPLAN